MGEIRHDDIIGADEHRRGVQRGRGVPASVTSSLIRCFPCPEAPRYAPKDAADPGEGDIFPRRQLKQVPVPAMSSWLLGAVGEHGKVISYEVRQDHLDYAVSNVHNIMGGEPMNWTFAWATSRRPPRVRGRGRPRSAGHGSPALETVRTSSSRAVFMTYGYRPAADEGDGGHPELGCLLSRALGVAGARMEGGGLAPDQSTA